MFVFTCSTFVCGILYTADGGEWCIVNGLRLSLPVLAIYDSICVHITLYSIHVLARYKYTTEKRGCQ